ncbi:MAG: rhodanese-like domain-containing protein [Caryophanon sp.]|nr:rhodanese-like domain-containing protein [Caryophanon sp.]
MTTEQLQQKLQAGETCHVVDVREAAEYANGHIPGSMNMPLSLLEFRMHELQKNKPYFIICQAGGRSAQATALLQAQGYDVTNVAGGMNEWQGDVK